MVQVTIGQTVEPWVRVGVAADALPRLAVGQTVVVSVPRLPRDVPGRITAINEALGISIAPVGVGGARGG